MSVIRIVAERLSRDRVVRRTIITSHGAAPIFVSPDAQLKYLKFGADAFDSDLIKIADCLIEPTSVVWDIGANVGVFTFACALRSRAYTLAIEADTWLAGLIRRSAMLEAYKGRDVRILPAAVSNRDGVAEFLIAERGRASNALASAGGRSQMGGVRERVLVPTLTLDSIAGSQPSPDFVKIDVEGAELDVLLGAQSLLATRRPTLYIEIGASMFHKCTELLKSLEYEAFGIDGRPAEKQEQSNYFFVHSKNNAMKTAISALNR